MLKKAVSRFLVFFILLYFTWFIFVNMEIILSSSGVDNGSVERVMEEVWKNAFTSALLCVPVLVFWPRKFSLLFVGVFWGVFVVDGDHWLFVILKILGYDLNPSRTIYHSILFQMVWIIVVCFAVGSIYNKSNNKLIVIVRSVVDRIFGEKNIKISFSTLVLSGLCAFAGVAANFLVDLIYGWDKNIFWLIPNLIPHRPLSELEYGVCILGFISVGIFLGFWLKAGQITIERIKNKKVIRN